MLPSIRSYVPNFGVRTQFFAQNYSTQIFRKQDNCYLTTPKLPVFYPDNVENLRKLRDWTL